MTIIESTKDFMKCVRQLRFNANEMTRAELSRHIGVMPSTVSRYFDGKMDIKLTTAIKMLDVFGYQFIVEKK